jgi:hypothetical protein
MTVFGSSSSIATIGKLILSAGAALTVADHTCPAPTSSRHDLTGGAVELWTIPVGVPNQVLVLSSSTGVTIINGNGNLQTGLDFSFDHAGDRMALICDGSNWYKIAPGSASVA